MNPDVVVRIPEQDRLAQAIDTVEIDPVFPAVGSGPRLEVMNSKQASDFRIVDDIPNTQLTDSAGRGGHRTLSH